MKAATWMGVRPDWREAGREGGREGGGGRERERKRARGRERDMEGEGGEGREGGREAVGRAHVRTPDTGTNRVCSLLLVTKKHRRSG